MCIFLLGIVKFARNLYKVFRTNCDEINTKLNAVLLVVYFIFIHFVLFFSTHIT